MQITKESRIVEVFSKDLLKAEVDRNELKDANEYIRELASNPNPNNCYEIAQILKYVIDEGLTQRVQYIEEIADVKRTGIGEKAQFKIEVEDLKAMFQAKGSTTERSKISHKYFTLDTDEVSIRPVVDLYEIQTGKVDFTKISQRAVDKLELEIVKRVQNVIYAAFSAMSTPNYAVGSGIVKSAFDPILYAMMRVGGSASIVGDIEALSKFTALTGFNNTVADTLAVEHNQNGMIGTYLGAKLMKLNNPFVANSLTETVLRKDLIYVIPTGDAELRPIKVQFEGELQAIGTPVNIDSKQMEMRFDQYVGVGITATRKLMGVYEDQTL
ncbi:hypothetical protein AXJ14_gp017 [Geobacillus virus E3]|jgi:hypothetical protein|uniref:hypothetical protein n=1 Tax=Geobacillus virus E3 TaxID=1572712 RepID=UPI00067188E8|nr:hypothetical protein AXJ14_gp017 [Geobacillus virus E3]AJA41336.1 hypothetical protein E3_017 [Geobacillus virus E3]